MIPGIRVMVTNKIALALRIGKKRKEKQLVFFRLTRGEAAVNNAELQARRSEGRNTTESGR